jgi:hypothetical protein
MGIDYSLTTTANLHELERVGTAMTDALFELIRAKYPEHDIDEFFHGDLPVPNVGFVRSLGDEAFFNALMTGCNAACAAILARHELETRRYPN